MYVAADRKMFAMNAVTIISITGHGSYNSRTSVKVEMDQY